MRSECPTVETRVDISDFERERGLAVGCFSHLELRLGRIERASHGLRSVGWAYIVRFEVGQPAREYLLEQGLAARELCSAQN